MILLIAGSVMMGTTDVRGVFLPQLLWGLNFIVSLIAIPILDATHSRAYRLDRRDADAKARAQAEALRIKNEQAAIAQKRQQEMDHAEKIERQRNWTKRATQDGIMTGYEPQILKDVELQKFKNMHGYPGFGLAESGFSEANIKRGQEGELNFAKALQMDNLLDKFSSFWSVHMPDSEIGVSEKFQTDIDCVLVTGNSVWLVDVKNYVQGDVTWINEYREDEKSGPGDYLVAVDNHKEGYVGEPRKMSRNMELAVNSFKKRFESAGIFFTVKPVVVMMPRQNGIGVIKDVTWPGDIPTAILPHLLHWLKSEPDFDQSNEDARLLVAILRALTKIEPSGDAAKNNVGKTSDTASSYAGTQTTASAGSSSIFDNDIFDPMFSATNNNDADEPAKCSSCDAEIEADWEFCYSCGAEFTKV